MKIKNFYFFCRWLDKLIKTRETDEKVDAIKKDTINQISQTTKSVQKVGELQNLVLKKTTTYYIGKAMGAIK